MSDNLTHALQERRSHRRILWLTIQGQKSTLYPEVSCSIATHIQLSSFTKRVVMRRHRLSTTPLSIQATPANLLTTQLGKMVPSGNLFQKRWGREQTGYLMGRWKRSGSLMSRNTAI